VSTDNYIKIKTDSVQSVQSVQTSDNIVNTDNPIILHIKEHYDKLNKPDSIKDLEKLKNNIITMILSDNRFDNHNDEYVEKVVNDYLHVRGWL
jgi:tRNA uridine 5-carbamoylmethylation protein Kti12